MDNSSVQVAVRCRPLSTREKVESPGTCLTTDSSSHSVQIGTRTFTFDQVFGLESGQVEIFQSCVEPLLDSSLAGYNAAILAYGQTGSGKTFTMGSALLPGTPEAVKGIIPRVIERLVAEVQARKETSAPVLRVSFLEIYNEEIRDLLTPSNEKPITVREEAGAITLPGLSEEAVTTAEEMANCLARGSLNRVTAATMMNEQSSRSHAIFTISLEQIENECVICSKFTFVDLAGSERIKRTGAVGAVLKEGISINLGLLTLGKVISSLTEEGRKGHVPYRESKLTRILQDSLGGNSKTWMIACVSPAEDSFDETLNTLRYASNARKIKNKPVVNRDPKSQMILELRQEVEILKMELCRLKGEEYVPTAKSSVLAGAMTDISTQPVSVASLVYSESRTSPLKPSSSLPTSLSLPASEQFQPASMLHSFSEDFCTPRPSLMSMDTSGEDQRLKELAATIAAALNLNFPAESDSVQDEVATVLEKSASERENLLSTIYDSLAEMQKQIMDSVKDQLPTTRDTGDTSSPKEDPERSKEQQKLMSLIEKQKEKIEKLAKENSHEKDQRLNLAKKLKAETASITKWKSQTAKELIKLKRTEIQKTQQVTKLEDRLKKTDALAKRKIEELSTLQRKQRTLAEKLKRKEGLENPEELREWVQTFAKACYEYGELTEAQNALKAEEVKIAGSLDTMRDSKMRLKLSLEKLRLEASSPDVHEEAELAEQLTEILEEEDTLLEKLAYCQDKLSDFEVLLGACDFEEVRNRTQTMTTLADAHVLVEALLEEVITQIGKLKKTENSLTLAIDEGRSTAEQLIQERSMLNQKWKQDFERLQTDFRQREAELLQSLCDRDQDTCSNCPSCADRDIHITELQLELETSTNQYNQSIAKCNLMKKQIEELQQELGLADKQTRPKSANFSAIMDKTLRRLSSSVSASEVLSLRPEWTLQAHAHDIKCILQVEEKIVSASYRSCKVWNLEDRKLVQEMSGHSDYIKSLQWWPEYNSLVTVSKSTIVLWDLNSGHSVKTLKASPKLDLRTVQTWENYLAAAGQGVETCPRLELWDLRRADL